MLSHDGTTRGIETTLYRILKLANIARVVVLQEALHHSWPEVLVGLTLGVQTAPERR